MKAASTITQDQSPIARRGAMAAAGVLAVIIAITGLTPATASVATTPGFVAIPSKYADGTYIVTLSSDAAAAYAGGLTGLPATRVDSGDQLRSRDSAVKKYVSFLHGKQSRVAQSVGARVLYKYALAYNGFAAVLTGKQASILAATAGVVSVVPNTILPITATTDYLGVRKAGDAWSQVGGSSKAGEGVVVGFVDTGIAPENPSFGGDPLDTTSSTTVPWLNGESVNFTKSDGGTFVGARTTGVQFDTSDITTKVIGARYFVDGFGAANIGSPVDYAEYLSPRDGAGHGSHTASTAAGDTNVTALESGVPMGVISGVAPAAKIAVYKACWTGNDETQDGCATADIIGAIEAAVSDGVDVINYSIGGGAAETTYSPIDAAFLNAAAAGIFVSAAAGNAGPSTSTLDNAAPWEATVAATTTAGSGSGGPYPQIADFSSRGPVLAAGSDILKPNFAAPGDEILAATANAEGADPTWQFYSGTSMATPHVSGLAAIYLGVHPLASPAEITSSLSTTATDSVTATGAASKRPFAQGAGVVRSRLFLSPGMVYLNGIDDWQSYLVGTGQAAFTGVSAIDPSDLNVPSISIGDLLGTQTVTRTVTSTAAGIWKASSSVPGLKLTVVPATLSFAAAGETKSFTVKVTRTTARLDRWATGYLTWTRTSGSVRARIPVVAHPTSLLIPDGVVGEGTGGTAEIGLRFGTTKALSVATNGLAIREQVQNPGNTDADFTGTAITGGYGTFPITIATGTNFARFEVDSAADGDADLDLYVYRCFVPGRCIPVGSSTSSGAHEIVDLANPGAGAYEIIVDYFSAPDAGMPFQLATYALNPTTNSGNFHAAPATVSGTMGSSSYVLLRWGGLLPDSDYLGVVSYSSVAKRTVVTISTGAAVPPVSVSRPRIVGGERAVGNSVRAAPGEWDANNLAFTYQWQIDGADVDGATDSSFTIPDGMAGKSLTVLVTATLPYPSSSVTATSLPATIKSK